MSDEFNYPTRDELRELSDALASNPSLTDAERDILARTIVAAEESISLRDWEARYISHMETHDLPAVEPEPIASRAVDLEREQEAAMAESLQRESDYFREREDRG